MTNHASNVVRLRSATSDKTGGDTALQRTVAEHEPALRRFARARLAGHPDYEDIVQEVFLRLARQNRWEERLGGSLDAVRSYLFSIATNVIRDRYRQSVMRRKHSVMTEHEADAGAHYPACSSEDIVSAQEQLVAVTSALMKLQPGCRHAFVLSRFEGLSYRQIADKMNISVSMVEKHVMRALAGIRRSIERAGQ